jgi:NADH-quinone oxidoreductase subunit A
MSQYAPALAVLLLAVALVVLVYVVGALVAVRRQPLVADEFLGGSSPAVHAVSRYHARWYAVTLIFLAFDMEMVFMYPWAVVFAEIGIAALVEMFVFLGILMAGVVYAWREGALRWQ